MSRSLLPYRDNWEMIYRVSPLSSKRTHKALVASRCDGWDCSLARVDLVLLVIVLDFLLIPIDDAKLLLLEYNN